MGFLQGWADDPPPFYAFFRYLQIAWILRRKVGREVMASTLHSSRYRILVARLRSAREAAGLTQEEAATAMGKPQSWISRLETQRRRVDWIELEDLAALYKKPIRFFRTR